MKKIDNYICRKYGSENTHLTLTQKADRLYSETDPLNIYEREIDLENEDGEIVSTGYLYAVDGAFTTKDLSGRFNWIAEDELNEMLETVADELEAADTVPGFEYAVALMDDELREEVHSEIAPCSEAAFLAEYKRRHFEKYGEEFLY